MFAAAKITENQKFTTIFWLRQPLVLVQHSSNTFLSLRGAIATKQSLSEAHQSNYNSLQLRNEIATPQQVGARNDTGGLLPDVKNI